MIKKTNKNSPPSPTIEIDFSMPFLMWKTIDFDVETCAETAIFKTIEMAELPLPIKDRDLDISIVLTNDEMITELNHQYKNKQAPTNVLSFSALDGATELPEGFPCTLGDVVLAFETIDKERQEQGKTFSDHYTHLIIHGTLHLLGYDHEKNEEAEAMEQLETEILATLKIASPYQDY